MAPEHHRSGCSNRFQGTLTLPDQVAFYQARLAKAGYTRDSPALQEELARLARFNGNPHWRQPFWKQY